MYMTNGRGSSSYTERASSTTIRQVHLVIDASAYGPVPGGDQEKSPSGLSVFAYYNQSYNLTIVCYSCTRI